MIHISSGIIATRWWLHLVALAILNFKMNHKFKAVVHRKIDLESSASRSRPTIFKRVKNKSLCWICPYLQRLNFYVCGLQAYTITKYCLLRNSKIVVFGKVSSGKLNSQHLQTPKRWRLCVKLMRQYIKCSSLGRLGLCNHLDDDDSNYEKRYQLVSTKSTRWNYNAKRFTPSDSKSTWGRQTLPQKKESKTKKCLNIDTAQLNCLTSQVR